MKSKTIPPHPGAFLRENLLPSFNLTVSSVAKYLHVSRQMLSKILSQQSSVTPYMAVKLGKLFGYEPRYFLDMQAAYDLWHAEHELKDEIKSIPNLAKSKYISVVP
jgi:addiction module HigA family antidote